MISGKETTSPAIQALRTIRARIDGEFDHCDLVAFGPLSIDPLTDVREIAQITLGTGVAPTEDERYP